MYLLLGGGKQTPFLDKKKKRERELATPVFMLCPIQLTLSFWRSQ